MQPENRVDILVEILSGYNTEPGDRRLHPMCPKSYSNDVDHCYRLASCEECSVGVEILSRGVQRAYGEFILDTMYQRLIDMFVRTGANRTFPPVCDIPGRLKAVKDAFGDDIGAAAFGIRRVLSDWECLDRRSCISCPNGTALLVESLVDLSESGFESDTYQLLENRNGLAYLRVSP